MGCPYRSSQSTPLSTAGISRRIPHRRKSASKVPPATPGSPAHMRKRKHAEASGTPSSCLLESKGARSSPETTTRTPPPLRSPVDGLRQFYQFVLHVLHQNQSSTSNQGLSVAFPLLFWHHPYTRFPGSVPINPAFRIAHLSPQSADNVIFYARFNLD
jgi:hypothetical protein